MEAIASREHRLLTPRTAGNLQKLPARATTGRSESPAGTFLAESRPETVFTHAPSIRFQKRVAVGSSRAVRQEGMDLPRTGEPVHPAHGPLASDCASTKLGDKRPPWICATRCVHRSRVGSAANASGDD